MGAASLKDSVDNQEKSEASFMLGAIIGDVAGSRFEWTNIKSKEFELFTDECTPTDDSIMTFAIAKAILSCDTMDLSQAEEKAIMAFLESTSFEDAIRNAISIGGDSDTIGAITGSIAEAYYGIPVNIRNQAVQYLDEFLFEVLDEFETKYGPSTIKIWE